LVLALSGGSHTSEDLAREQNLPPRFLGAILTDLRRASLVASTRGAEGGFRLARPPEEVTLAMVFRAIDGPLAEVRGLRPEDIHYQGPAEYLQDVWVALRASLRGILENVTLADVVSSKLPRRVLKLTADPDAWASH
jgi:Rrf2 family protein